MFQLSAPPSLEGVPADTDKDGFKTFAEVQSVSPQHLRGYLAKASELANALFADTARRARVLGCEPTATDCLRSFVTRFGKLAYRRPLEAAEVDSIVSGATQNGVDQTDHFRYVIELLLTAPSFLYRIEVGNVVEGLSTLSGVELASRLSFGLWGRAPTTELLDQAAQGALDTEAGQSQMVSIMLADPKAQQFFSAFFQQWLTFDTLRAPTQPPMGWTNDLMPGMQAETDEVLREFAWTGKNFLDVLTANTTRVSPQIATFFGLPAPAADGAVQFPPGHVRYGSGILTHPSLLSAKGDGDLVAIRGNWVRETFFCEHMSVPASLAEEIGELLVGLSRTQIVQRRNMESACAGCHALIDPIGVGFAEFDTLGRYDETVDLAEYGVTPGLPGAAMPEFSNIGELAAKLRDMPRVPSCLASKVFIYVNGREAGPADTCALEAASNAFTQSISSFPALVKGLVESPAFRLRRVPAAAP